jgi:hypothetical protein
VKSMRRSMTAGLLAIILLAYPRTDPQRASHRSHDAAAARR